CRALTLQAACTEQKAKILKNRCIAEVHVAEARKQADNEARRAAQAAAAASADEQRREADARTEREREAMDRLQSQQNSVQSMQKAAGTLIDIFTRNRESSSTSATDTPTDPSPAANAVSRSDAYEYARDVKPLLVPPPPTPAELLKDWLSGTRTG